MLSTFTRRTNVLPAHILELIIAPSTSTLTRRSYNVYRHPLATDIEKPSSDILSKLSTLVRLDQEAKLPDALAETHNHLLDSLRVSLGSRNIFHIRNAYQQLVRHSSPAAIMARDFEEISRMLDTHFTQCSSFQDTRSGTREMAIEAAARGHITGLRACLLLYLKDGNIQAVLSTYNEFIDTRNAITRGLEHPAIAQRPKDVQDFPNLVTRPSNDYGVADLVLTVLAACASENRFDDAFDLFLETPMTVRLQTAKVEAFGQSFLRHDPSLAKKVKKWAEELVLLRLVSRESSLRNYISNLGNDKQIVPLERLYTSVVSQCKKVDGRLVMEPESLREGKAGELERRVVVMPGDAWSTFMQAFFKCHRPDLVEKLWDQVGKLGLSPNDRMWTALLDGYGRHGHLEKAMTVWRRMVEEGIEPDEISYGSMVSAYFLARRPNEAFALFEQFRRQLKETVEGRESLTAQSMLPLFNIVLHGLCTNAMDERARSVLKEMVEHGPKPDIVSYNTFLRHYGRIGDMKGLAGVLRALKPAGVQPDVHSFTTVLSALYKAGKPDAHTRTLEIMRTMGVQPNVATYSAIIDVLVRHGGEENFRRADDLLHEMENSPNKECQPNEVTYTGLLAGLHRDGSISRQNVKMYTSDLISRMRKHGTLPNRTTYHILIKACLENPEAEGLETALAYYREMEKRSVKLLNDTWYVMLAGLLRRRNLVLAREILRDMSRREPEPHSALVTLVERVQGEIALAKARGEI